MRTQQPPEPERACVAPGELTPTEVRGQLERILESRQFRRSERMQRFLTYVVEQRLSGERNFKEHAIATAVFDKPVHFDTRLDPIVRVEARRLRSRLTEYYAEAGADDPLIIRLPRGGYEPELELAGAPRRPAEEPQQPEQEAEPASAPSTVPPDFQAVAVLPFTDMSKSGDNKHFCDGLTEELINALTRVEGLEVVARSSSFQFHGPAHDVREVGRSLGVGAVMEGSVRRSEERIRITTQLTNANNGFHLWSETYDAKPGDDFDVQERIAKRIIETLKAQRPELLVSALTRRQSPEPEAFHEYLQGLYHLNQNNPSDLAAAVAEFDNAIAKDGSYAQAYAALAHAHCKLAWLVMSPPADAWPEVKRAAAKALELDASSAPARAALAYAHCICDWNWRAGEEEFRGAIEADPADYTARIWYAVAHLAPMGRLEEALEMAFGAAERSGYSLYTHNHVGLIYYYARDYEEAADKHRAILKIKPDFAPALWDLGRTLVQQAKLEEAEEAFDRAVKISGGHPMFVGSLAACRALLGRGQEARKLLAHLEKRAEKEYVTPLALAWIHVALGNHDRAFAQLQAAAEDRSVRLAELDVDAVYDDLRDDDRFEKLRKLVCLDLGAAQAAEAQ